MSFSLSTLPVSSADLLLLVLLLCAVRTDLSARRIPNVLIVCGLVMALVLAAIEGGVPGVLHAGAGSVVGLLVLLPFFALGMLGAGDVKLLAAVGAFAGVGGVLQIAVLTLIAGGLLGLAYLARVRGLRSLAFLRGGVSPVSAARVPYAVAILCGALAWWGVR